MFGALIESRPRQQRSTGAMVASIVAHAAVIGLAVQVTAGRAGTPPAEPVSVMHLPVPAPPLAPTSHARDRAPSPGAGPAAPERLPAAPGIHIDVPTVGIPTVPTWGAHLDNVLAGLGSGPSGTGEGGGRGGTYSPGVDVQARPLPDNPEPAYPSILRAAGIEGRVQAEFVVDTAGRVEPGSIHLEATGSDLFAAAVRRALERARYAPARAAGYPVRVLMERDFVFRILGR